MELASLEEIESAASLISDYFAPTPQYSWPLLNRRFKSEIWVKHENHTPIGSFKIRGGLNYLSKRRPEAVIAATRGNHGQSVAYAASRIGAKSTVVVPYGNSREKNAAMQALGAELIEYGKDFDEAKLHARSLVQSRNAHYVPSIHRDLVVGVSTYALELFKSVEDLDAVYVPLGLGSGICGVICAREALGLKAEVIAVVAENADAYALSFERNAVVETGYPDTIADGVAVRVPDPDVVQMLTQFVPRVVRVSESEISAAMRHYFTDTHNVAEGAGAAPLAAALKEDAQMGARRIAVICSGGNVDANVYRNVLG